MNGAIEMPFQRPTLQEITDRVTADFESRLALTGAVLRRSVVYVAARAIAGCSHLLHGFLVYLSKQILPTTSDAEFLAEQASLRGLQRTGATFAVGDVTVTGVAGSVIPLGTVLQRADETQFVTTVEKTLVTSSIDVPARSSMAGEGGNTNAGVAVTFVSPLSGVNAAAVVASGGIIGGAEQESDDNLRARLIEKIRKPSLGGAIYDYEAWAKEVAGVTRVWVSPLEGGAGTLTVRFVLDDDPVSIIPDSSKVAEVQNHIDAVRPVTAIVTVAAPVEDTLDFGITLAPATAEVKAAVEAELRDLLKRDASPGGTILLSRINEAISIAAGESDHTLNSPTADVVAATGAMAVFGTITWS